MTGQIPATGLSGHHFVKILPVGLQNGACQPVFFPPFNSLFIFNLSWIFSKPLFQAIIPSSCSRPLAQAAVPGH
jgi:hypothetical protein